LKEKTFKFQKKNAFVNCSSNQNYLIINQIHWINYKLPHG
jgi:hypothetical protein